MGSQLSTLTSSDVERFERDGYIVVRQAFSPADGLAMERRWWRSWRRRTASAGTTLQLAPDHGRPEGRQARSRPGQDPDRAGPRRLRRPARPGRLVAAAGLGPSARHLSRAGPLGGADQALALGQSLRAAPRSPDGAVRGQLHRLGRAARRRDADPFRLAPPAHRAGATDDRERAARSIAALPWERFHRSHPWLMALTGQAPSPADRIAAFMDRETLVEGVPLRVVELTGSRGTWSSATRSWSTAPRRTGARGRASCGSRSRSSATRAVRCETPLPGRRDADRD